MLLFKNLFVSLLSIGSRLLARAYWLAGAGIALDASPLPAYQTDFDDVAYISPPTDTTVMGAVSCSTTASG